MQARVWRFVFTKISIERIQLRKLWPRKRENILRNGTASLNGAYVARKGYQETNLETLSLAAKTRSQGYSKNLKIVSLWKSRYSKPSSPESAKSWTFLFSLPWPSMNVPKHTQTLRLSTAMTLTNSKLKLLKNFLRIRTNQKRLNGPEIISIEKEVV